MVQSFISADIGPLESGKREVGKNLAQSRVIGRIVQVKAHDATEVEQVLATLRAAGCQPEDLEIGRADLEDVFLEIMQGETLKEAA